MRSPRRTRYALALVVAAVCSGLADAAPAPSPPPSPTPAATPAPGGGSASETATSDDATPRGAMALFLDETRQGHYVEASRLLELAGAQPKPGSSGAAELAWKLDVVLDRKLWVDLQGLSDDPAGDTTDGSPARDRVGTISTPRGDVPVLLDRVRTKDGLDVWRISSATVSRVPYLYEQFGYGPLGRLLPRFFFLVSFMNVQLWQWLGLLLLVVVAYAASWLAVMIVLPLARKLAARTNTNVDDRLLRAGAAPVRALAAIGLFVAGAVLLLRLAVPAEQFVKDLGAAATVFAVTWLLLRALDVLTDVLLHHLERQDRKATTAVLPLGRKAVKVVIVLLAAVALFQTLGFNVTGLVASLGIGGLAVALAAQRTLENVFAGVSLISDQPVRVGEFCRFGDSLGTVEDVGLRSTRIRTLDRSVLSVPNSQFADLHIDNLSKRDLIRFNTVIGVRYETTADQMRHVLIDLREMLVAHPKISLEPFWRVRFVEFAAYSLNIELFAYVRTTDYGEYTAIQEDLLLRIMEIVEKNGTGMAFPSQTTYLGRDSGIDAERGEESARKVQKLREEGELPFPDVDERTLAELRDSLRYPPEGAKVS